jgi:hypothetical protein
MCLVKRERWSLLKTNYWQNGTIEENNISIMSRVVGHK